MSNTPNAMQRQSLSHRRSLADLVVMAALGMVSLAYAIGVGLSYRPELTIVNLITSAFMVGSLYWRRTRPLAVMWTVFIAGLFQAIALYYPTPAIIAVPLVSYSVAKFVDGHRARMVIMLGAIASIVAPVSWLREYGYSDFSAALIGGTLLAGICMTLVVTPYGLGRRLRDQAINRQREEYARSERVRLEIAQREQAARTAEMRARNDIARELHDIVAHSLSVMIVQAEGGRALATKNPEKAAEVLGTLADTGREALTEMRRLVGVLRADPGQPRPNADYAPSPGLGEISAMVARAGDRVEYQQSGPIPPVPATLGLTVYRVTQEALTNFLKHAGPTAHARVLVQYSPQRIFVEVTDDGVGAASSNDGQGNGLRGMHERVSSMGGILQAGALNTGGYQVRAMLPIPAPGPQWPSASARQSYFRA